MLYAAPEASVVWGWDIAGPLILIVIFLGLGIPMWVSMGIGVVLLLALTGTLPVSLIGESLFEGMDAFALIAVPLFILTGDALVRTGLSNRLLDIAAATTGGVRSGFGSATVLGCGFFSCISGSDAAGCAAVGRMTVDRLVEAGYPKAYASALVASGACTGILIPPSIAYIVIGLVLGVPTATLFTAAIIPGIMVLGTIMLTNSALNRIRGYEHSSQKFDLKVWLDAVWTGRYAILVPTIILGGIYSGIFTPTEAAAIAVVTTILIGFFLGTLRPGDVPAMLISSAKVNGVILPTVALSLPLAEAIGSIGIPQAVIEGMLALTDSRVIIILLMMIIFIVAGCVMEAVPNIVLIAPVLFPLAQEIGMDDIHFCIMMVTSLGIGFVTPPIGLNLFVITGITGEPIMRVAAYAAPFVLAMLGVAFILAYFPWFSLVLLR